MGTTTTDAPETTTGAPSKPSSKAPTTTDAPETTTGAPSKPSSEATPVPESTTVLIEDPTTTENIEKLVEDIEKKKKNIEDMLDDIEAKDNYGYSKYSKYSKYL